MFSFTHSVFVHETPESCGHFTGKEDHQKEEELSKKNPSKTYKTLWENRNLCRRQILKCSPFPVDTEIPEWHRNIQGIPPASSQLQLLSGCTHLYSKKKSNTLSLTPPGGSKVRNRSFCLLSTQCLVMGFLHVLPAFSVR